MYILIPCPLFNDTMHDFVVVVVVVVVVTVVVVDVVVVVKIYMG